MIRTENKNFFYDNPIYQNWKYYIRFYISILKDILFKILLNINPAPLRDTKYKYSICSIFKNEAPYIREWIEYHLLLGFEHFYLYQNNSTDNYLEVLKPYIEKGVVTLIEWPEHPGQLSSYKHWYATYRNETQWVSFLDLDEFFCPNRATSVDEWMSPFKNYPVVMIYWQMFGTNGLIEHDSNKPVIEQYINSWEKKVNIGKLIYNTSYDISTFFRGMMHSFDVKYMGLNIPPINQYGYFVCNGIHRYNNHDDVQINHYWSKSYGNYKKKHERGSAAFGKSWKTFDQFLWHEHFNTSSNYVIFRFLTELKLKLRGDYPEQV